MIAKLKAWWRKRVSWYNENRDHDAGFQGAYWLLLNKEFTPSELQAELNARNGNKPHADWPAYDRGREAAVDQYIKRHTVVTLPNQPEQITKLTVTELELKLFLSYTPEQRKVLTDYWKEHNK